MAKRKINIQRSLGVRGSSEKQFESTSPIEQLTEGMSTSDIGFKPTNQRVYEIDLERITPDFSQPRRLLPHDLRHSLAAGDFTPADVMRQLVLRAEQDDMVALLVLGGKDKGPADEEDAVIEDTGLLALARSIQEVGLRQPLNVYRVDDPSQSDQISYRLGEGERRYWAHHLLVQQGYEQFQRVKCIVETLPDDEEVIHQRQEAENAARVDLPAIARARSMERIRERLTVEMGTRVPGENTIKLPGQRELQIAVGQRVKSFTGRAIGDRMVRNYLSLLNLPPEAQDLAEAAQLSEKQLRPVMRLDSDAEQLATIRRIIEEKLSGRQVLRAVTETKPAPPSPPASLREVKQTSVEQRFEKRVLDAAKTMHSLLTMPSENYEDAVVALASRAQDDKTRQALQSLRETLEDVLLRVAHVSTAEATEVPLLSIIPPLEGLMRHLPADRAAELENDILTGGQILNQLLAWQENDAVLTSRLASFFDNVETQAQALRAGEGTPLPILEGEKSERYPDAILYRVVAGATLYWAHELLVNRGEAEFKQMTAQITNVKFLDDDSSESAAPDDDF